MIKDITLKNFNIEGEDLSRVLEFDECRGKLISVFVDFNKDISCNVEVKLITKLGEEVLAINNVNKKPKEVFYPRLNAIGGRKHDAVMPENVGDNSEYYYFNNPLDMEIKKDNLDEKRALINKIIITYDE